MMDMKIVGHIRPQTYQTCECSRMVDLSPNGFTPGIPAVYMSVK